MAYQHTNSKGVTYYLHKSEVTLRGGKRKSTQWLLDFEEKSLIFARRILFRYSKNSLLMRRDFCISIFSKIAIIFFILP